MVHVEVKRKPPKGDEPPPGGPQAPRRPHTPQQQGCGTLLIKWLLSAAVIWAIAELLPGVKVESYAYALLVAAVLGVLNAVVKPIMIIITIPITLMTLGLFLLVINALVLLLADWMLAKFTIDSFWWAVGAAILISLANAVIDRMMRGK